MIPRGIARYYRALVIVTSCFLLPVAYAEDELISPIPKNFPDVNPDVSGKTQINGFDVEISPVRVQAGGTAIVSIKAPQSAQSEYKAAVAYDQVEFDLVPTSHLSSRFQQQKDGWVGVLGIPLNRKIGPYKIQCCLEKKVKNDGKGIREVKEVKSDKTCGELTVEVLDRAELAETEVIKMEDHKVIPVDPRLVARMIKEEERLNMLFDSETHYSLWDGAFKEPVAQSISSKFAIGRVYKADSKHRIHWGIDFRAPIGTPVQAAQVGKVVYIGDLFFSGKTIVVDHGFGIFTLYAHLKSISVQVKDLVKKGTVLGISGQTGKATGPLVHWQAVIHRVKVDPLQLVQVSSVF